MCGTQYLYIHTALQKVDNPSWLKKILFIENIKINYYQYYFSEKGKEIVGSVRSPDLYFSLSMFLRSFNSYMHVLFFNIFSIIETK